MSRNIDGELEATVRALDWCQQHNQKAIICHDYEGVGRWATGEWKASSAVAKAYCERVQQQLAGVRFCKVSAHTGNRWNDRADELAKRGIGLL